MKKTAILVAGLIVAAMFVATCYSSVKTEKIFAAQTEKMRELYGPMLGVSLDNYERGFFHSQAKTSVQVGQAKPVHMLHRVKHLPWGARVVTTVDQDVYTDEDLAAIREQLPLDQLKLVCHFGITGSSDAKMEIPAIAMEQNGAKISLAGIGLTGGLNAAMDRGDFDVRIASLQVQTPDEKDCTIAGLRYFGTYREVDGFPLGEGAFQLDDIQIMHGDIVTHALKNLLCRFSSTLTDQTFNEYVDITFGNIAVSGASSSGGQLKFDITGLDAESVRAIRDVYRVSSAEALDEGGVDPFMLQLQVMSKSMELLQKGMHFKLDTLRLEHANGAMSAEGFVDLKKREDEAAPVFDLKNIEAQASLYFDKGAFADGYRLASALRGNHSPAEDLSLQAKTLAQSLLAQGVLIEAEDGGLRADLSFVDGKARLNGKPLSR